MELAGLLNRKSVQNAFLIGLLLTGSMEEAEDAVMDSVDCSDTSDLCGERIFRKVIHSSLGQKSMRSASDTIEDDSAAVLPLELRRVLYLPRELRECFVLRMLVGLPGESCAWLLKVDRSEIGLRLQKAVTKLAGFYRDEGDAADCEVDLGAEMYA